jgi:RHS repeat-associated protein
MARFAIAVGLSDSLLCTRRRGLKQESTGKITGLTFQILGAFGLFLLLTVSRSIAQAPNPNAGILMWSTNDFGINLATSGINIDIPLRSKVGAIPFSSRLFGTSQAYESTAGGGAIIYTNPYIGSYSDPTAVTVFMTGTNGDCVGHPTETYIQYTLLGITDVTGATHPLGTFSNPTWTLSNYCPVTPGPLVTTDGSGYTFVASSSGDYTIYDRSGLNWGGYCSLSNGVGACGVSGAVVDPDKNSISGLLTLGYISGSVTDTLDTAVLTANGSGGQITSYSYTDAQGTTQYYTYGYNSTNHLKTNFACQYWNDWSGNNATFTTSLTIPGGGQYLFSYEPTPNGNGFTNTNPPTYFTGRIAQITFPSGGSISYAYSGGNNGFNCNSGVVPTITVTLNDNNGNSGRWTYVNSNSSTTNFTVAKTDPAGNQTVYNFSGEYQTQAATYQGGCPTTITGCNGGGTLLRTITTCYNGNFASCATPSTVPTLPISQTDVYTSFNGSSLNNLIEIKFDTSYGNITEVKRYDFGVAMGAAPTVSPLSDALTYYGQSWNGTSCSAYPSGTYIYNTPCYSYTKNSAGATVAQTQITYSITGHPTSTSRWVSGSTWLPALGTVTASYNMNGTLAWSKDAAGNQTTFAYNGTGGCNNLLITSTTYPLTSVGSDSQTWDCNGGVVTSAKDVNGNTTSYSYTANGADPLYRLKFITRPDGGSSNFSYHTGSGAWSAGVWTQTSSSSGFQHTVSYDGLDRPIATYDTDPNSPTGTRYGGTTYNTLGQVVYSYNPYFCNGTTCSPTDATYGYAAYSYDALGRITQITPPSGLATQYSYTNRAMKAVQFPSGNAFTKVYQSDGLGRLTDICEVTSVTQANDTAPYSCALDISATGFHSTVTYDALNNVLTLNRDVGAQQRSMQYDGLSRLLSVTTPESGTTSYVYDTLTAGDLYTETRPLPNYASGHEVVTYGFDQMHRLTSKSYSDGTTPGLSLVYDQANSPTHWPNNNGTTVSLPNGKGRLSWIRPGASGIADTLYGYDSIGRISVYGQCAPTGCNSGVGFVADYNYDYIGDVLNGNNILHNFAWTNTYNAIGQLMQVYTSELTSTSSGDLVSGITYNALGQPTVDLLGNGEQEVWKYSIDGVPKNYSVGSGPVFDWNLTVNTGVISASNDNQYAGSLYTYDDFGRLATMTGANGQGWGFSYGYDQYGNRWDQTVTQGSGPHPVYSFSPSNKITTGISYDDAGNVTYDGYYYYKYDGNSKVIAVGTTSGVSNVASYLYNTRGMRVSTDVLSGGTVEWMFDLAGNALVASVPGTTQFYQAEYFVGGRDWGTLGTGGVNFRYPDWVGNGRVWQDVAGTVTQQAAYAAFGDGLFSPGGGSCCNLAAGMYDSAWQDSANNTYHTLNREYSPSQGRWLTPDPAGLTAMDLSKPQTWNRYAYALNNPVMHSDPTGLDDCLEEDDCGGGGSGGGGGCYDLYDCGGGGWGWGGGGSGGGGGLAPPPGGPLNTGQAIFSGQDCLSCFPSGPSPLQIVQAILSGNLWGTLGGPPLTNCLPICDFTTVPGYQPPTSAQLFYLELTQGMTNLFWDTPGPPRLCRSYQCNAATISGPELATVSAVQPTPPSPPPSLGQLVQALQTCATWLPVIMNGNGGSVAPPSVDQYPEGQMGTQNSNNYQVYNPVSQAQGAAAGNAAGQLGTLSGCTGGALSR